MAFLQLCWKTFQPLLLYLSLLFELFMLTSEIPSIWKVAHVRPIFKKANPASVGNYRPISLISVCCKVMERIIADNLFDYLLRNNLIISEQFGFLPKRSTCTQLLSFLNFLTYHCDHHNRIDAAYIDFAKAFDSVSHNKIIQKCSMYGIKYELLNWLTSYLSNRTQCTY